VSETPVLPEFVYAFLQERYEKTRGGSSGGNQPALNKGRIEGFNIPVPSVAEQKEIVERINVAESAWDGDTLDVDLGSALRQSILAAAFRSDLLA
jgi:type I restriction enzyme, S subunit